MTTTSFYKDESYYENCEHDDIMTADDYERREYYRNGWNESQYDRQRW